jgi:hypothetical protein
LLIASTFLISFDLNYFVYPAMGWHFLGEEGENLAWAQSIINGGVFGKDFFCLYGPMLVYPLTWFMRLLGATVFTERLYTYVINLLAYGVIIGFFFRISRTRMMFVIGSLGYLFIFYPLLIHFPNGSFLRVGLGFLPLLFSYIYRETERRAFLALAGAVAGQSLLFSQEVGLCSTIAVCIFLAAECLAERRMADLVREVMLMLGALMVSLLPMLGYFWFRGALGSFIKMLLEYPHLVQLGYANISFPSLSSFLATPLDPGLLMHYWLLLIYAALLTLLIPSVFLKRTDRGLHMQLAILVFGLILFRSALGRSDEYHVYYASQPAFILCFLAIDRALATLRSRSMPLIKIACFVLVIVIATTLTVLGGHSVVISATVKQLKENSLESRWRAKQNGVSIPRLERAGGIFFEGDLAASILKIGNFLEVNTRPGEYVYFYPNEAAYYFLFNRNNPTRYAISYFAATSRHRRELVADLERHKPRFVVESLTTWRIDGIPAEVQVPEVDAYIRHAYKTYLDLGEIVILKRIDASI